MRKPVFYAGVLLIALTLTGCSAASGVLGSTPVANPFASPTATTVPSSPALPPTPVNSPAPPAGTSATMSSDPALAAIQAVIQKADQEQQTAFEQNDPTIMKDTATTSYYNELAQINSQMANGGVSAIKLIGIDWGPVKLTNSTTAQATTYETWQTTYSDGTTDQAREQNVYTLVQQQGSWLIQTDDHPNANNGQPGGSAAPGPSAPVPPTSPSSPVPPATAPATGSDTSRNWAGYAASTGTFTAVTGTWTVPQSQSNGSLSSGATWVGIGGVNTRDLIQAGTEATTSRSGGTSYDAWIETLPQAAHVVQFAVKPGDSVTVSLTEQGTDQWLIKFTNNTTGEGYQTTVQYHSSLSSAEWIEEAPSAAGGRGGGRILPLDNFGSVQFSNGSAVENGKTVTIADTGAGPITLTAGRGQVLAAPSVLTADGQGFSVSQSGTTAGAVIP